MLRSLFGDLPPDRGPDGKNPASSDRLPQGFAITAAPETGTPQTGALAPPIDRHSHDLIVTGSPAHAIRRRFSVTRSDLASATSLITLLDPTGVWASAVIKALSDASGRPVERLHLRDQATLRTLATIERTTLLRRHDDTLRIYHADVRALGADNAEIPVVLMERSQMTAVILGTLEPHILNALLATLRTAAMLPTWHCPHLLFMIPPDTQWMVEKVNAVHWSARMQVHIVSETMSGAASVWNAVLGMWNQIKIQSPVKAVATGSALSNPQENTTGACDAQTVAPVPHPASAAVPWMDTLPVVPAMLKPGIDTTPPETATALPPASGADRPLDPARARLALRSMLALDGLLGCAVVDIDTGSILAREVREARENRPLDIDLAGAACAQVLRAHRDAALSMGLPEQIDEVMTSAGPRHQVIRVVARHPYLFLMALLEKQRSNLALARSRLMEVERKLL